MADQNLKQKISATLQRATSEIVSGARAAHIDLGGSSGNQPSLVNTGAAIFFDQDQSVSITPDTRNIVTLSPDATILVKKKAFSSFGAINDLRYVDKTEKMLLRATKALFAYKVQQIRAYESLTKFENFFSTNQMYSVNLLSSLMREGSFLDIDKLGKTKDEYISEKLELWLKKDMSAVSFDTTTQSFDDFSSGNSPKATFDIATKTFVINSDNRKTITNGEYLSNIPSSQAREILANKRVSFGAEYDGIHSPRNPFDDANQNLSDSLKVGKGSDPEDPLKDFFDDIGSLISFGSAEDKYNKMNEDIASVLKRNAFSTDRQLTTWIVDHDSPDNYIVGPGTGVIELALFTSFNTNIGYSSSPASASFNLAYPYRVGVILENDIEGAIQEALHGSIGILAELLSGGLGASRGDGSMPQMDASAALSSVIELSGLGGADKSLDVDYIRDRLRTFYLGKNFINASDPVHFYIRGNRTFSDYTEFGSAYSEEMSDSPFDDELLEIDNSILKAEYVLYTDQNIPIEQYRKLRGAQDNSFGMIHVFGGFVTSVSESYSGGFHTLSVSCTDNMSWLKWSQFAIQPALSDPKGILEDPLTPYEFARDEQGAVIPGSRELIYENKQLLSSGMLSYDSGIFAGQNASQGNLLQGQYNGVGSLKGKKILQHPSGFVYRWKSGIITATAGFQAADSTGESQDNVDFSENYQPTVTNDILNNLDIPNILSILIVGQPYNIQTFIEQALVAHNKGNRSSSFSPLDPLTGVLDTVRKQNNYYGNFQPYRMLTMNSASTNQVLSSTGIRDVANNNITSLQDRKRLLRKKSRDISDSGKTPQLNAYVSTIASEIELIDRAISEQIRIGTEADGALTAEKKIGIQIGLSGATNLPISGDAEEDNDITRAMMIVGAQRKIEDVRLNRDKNLFIVSDQYDSADIRPFILKLNSSGWNLFDGTFKDSWQLCNEASNYLDLEFFCNSQGHLEFRPPPWNKVPISVLKESIKRQTKEKKNIIPSFVTDLFQTRIEGLYLQIHTLNVKIAIIALMLGKYPDKTLIPNMSLSGSKSLNFFGVRFDSTKDNLDDENGNPSNGSQSGKRLKLFQTNFDTKGPLSSRSPSLNKNNLNIAASFQRKGDVLLGNTEKILGTFDPIIEEQIGSINNIETSQNEKGGTSAIKYDADDINNIRDSFRKQFGRDPANGLKIGEALSELDLVFKMKDGDEKDAAIYASGGLRTNLKKAISERDSFVTMLQANLLKERELKDIETFIQTGEESDDIDTGINDRVVDFLERSANALKARSDILSGKLAEGSVYDHLIEDDTRNLLGYGSGKRFIIKDEYIIGSTFNEDPPEFTRLDIKGDAPLIGDSFNRSFEGLYFWAGATDYDLWRQYGYKFASKSVPFISDNEGQAKPYAILKLGMQKFAVNTGKITSVGNEFYQPGDTVYIPSKGLLYYVKSVQHSFSFGSQFTTTLDLEYGHPVGDYIPGPLDIIGQQMVSNFLEDPSLIYRSSETDDNYRPLSPDSSLIFPSENASIVNLLSFNDNQVRFTNMMLDVMGGLAGQKYILIRGFALDEDDSEGIESAKNKLSKVRELFERPMQTAAPNLALNGTTERTLRPMNLPNSAFVPNIQPYKIIEQVSYFRKSGKNLSGEIKCLDRKLSAAIRYDETFNSPDENSAAGIFPKGGPSQSGWSDIRTEVIGVGERSTYKSNIIEVGIVTISDNLLNTRES